MQKRFILFLLLSAVIFLGWQLAVPRFFPQLAPPVKSQETASVTTPVPAPASSQAPAPTPVSQSPVPAAPTTQEAQREFAVRTDYWAGRLSNEGAVLTEWKVTRFTDGKMVDEKVGGVTLVAAETSREIGAPFRVFIPTDNALEQELNRARFAVEGLPSGDLSLSRTEEKDVTFVYRNNGVIAIKKFTFNGSGYDFAVQLEVTRNAQPIEVYFVVGPNFGDQSITQHSTYRPPPQVSYAVGTSVKRESATSVTSSPQLIQASPVRWTAIDDNYFAMALVPAKPANALAVFNTKRSENIGGKPVERNYVSVGVPVVAGERNFIYAGPKDLNTLTKISQKFGLGDGSGNLEDVVNYGWLSFISFVIKPLSHFMLNSLLFINKFTHNYGWAIVVLTIVLNMFFFPLRWKSSVAMRRTAAMQPKMKDLQERMKKFDKSDPRMQELQKEQIALMREGNPLMGCLPLLLQMPFFLSVFTILTVSIEVRHAPFIAWIRDLSAPDPYWILPIVMCASMIVQQALTPTTADPMQKRIGYLMPLIFAYFLTSAPAGLVLYWMMSNLVGIAQQFVINKLNPPAPPATTKQSQTDKPRTSISKASKGPKGNKSKPELASS
ncbi:MAG: membrane protein insertase YidC [Acidobacteriota bacterium]